MRKTLAVYAGTFDPPTVGHLWIIKQGIKLFNQFVVAIGVNPEKRCMFSVEERLDMIRESTKQFPNLRIETFTNQYLITYAQSVGAKFILRGIRSEGDYEFERVMRNINSDLAPDIITVFLIPPREIVEVSSSIVKGLVGPEGWEKIVRKYVPQPVFEKLKKLHSRKPLKGGG